MPRVIRSLLDFSQGHCFNPAPCLTGSSDLFINGSPAVRQSDNYVSVHVCGDSAHSMGIALEGSTTVFNNGLGLHCDSQKIACGDVADNGSLDVFADSGGNSNAGNTLGYTVNSPIITYPDVSFKIFRQISGDLCRFIQGSTISTKFDTEIIPEFYTPIVEEDTGRIIKDQTVPVNITITPELPQGVTFNFGIVSIDFSVTPVLSPEIEYTVEIANYVGVDTFKFKLAILQAGILFVCQ